MQELIVHLEMLKSRVDMADIDSLIEYATTSLEKEKEQIINDYGKGKVDLFMFYKDLGPDKTAEQYYNQTYNQNK